MEYGHSPITVVGNLADDVKVGYTVEGKPYAKLVVIVTVKLKQGDRYVDGDRTTYYWTCFGSMAENAAQSLGKGSRVIVHGIYRQRQYTTMADGAQEVRTNWEGMVQDLGVEIRFNPATTAKLVRSAHTTPDTTWDAA